MTSARLAIVTLGRDSGGERRRVETWRALADAADLEPVVVRALGRPGAGVGDVIAGAAVPETLAWSAARVRAVLDTVDPIAVVSVTLRSWRPGLARSRPQVLDLVDRLGLSYRQRASWSGPLGQLAYPVLARASDRVERQVASAPMATVAAGHGDAAALGVTWLPNVVASRALTPGPAESEFDVGFVGSLSYAPNVEALHYLAEIALPHWRVLVIGRRPGRAVRRLGARRGWTVAADVVDPVAELRRAAVAVAPIRSATGIQNKMLEAAVAGVPQVVSSEAAAGVGPQFPCEVAPDGPSFTRAVEMLLRDPLRRSELARRAQAHVAARFTAAAWAPVVRDLIAHQALRRGRDA